MTARHRHPHCADAGPGPDLAGEGRAEQDEAGRAARLSALKAQIRAGAYKPDIKDVAYFLASVMSRQP